MQSRTNRYRYISVLSIVILLTLIFTGCMNPDPIPPEPTSEHLSIYTWEEYWAPGILEYFEEDQGVNITEYYYSSESECISEVTFNPEKYDIVVTSNLALQQLIQVKMLNQIQTSELSNYGNLDSSILNLSFDPDCEYTIPYLWGTTGIAYNMSAVAPTPDSWSLLWNEAYNGSISMIGEKTDVIYAALFYLGYPITTTNITQLDEAKDSLLDQQSLIIGYPDPESIMNGLVDGYIHAVVTYSGDALQCVDENEAIDYFVPTEGGMIWIDSLAITCGAKNVDVAYSFIDYILQGKVIAQISNYQWYANANSASIPYLDEELLDNPLVYIPADERSNLHPYPLASSEINSYYNIIWSEIQQNWSKDQQ